MFFLLVPHHQPLFQPWELIFNNQTECEQVLKKETKDFELALPKRSFVAGECVHISNMYLF